MSSAPSPVQLSVVVPLYDEQDAVAQLYGELTTSCSALGRTYELLFVDDGSRDDTLARLKELARNDDRMSVVSLRRNFGQTAALSAGIDRARGEVIVTLDGDLQNDPADIHLLLAELDRGYDLVSGWRHPRRDSFLTRRLPSSVANYAISRQTGVVLHDYGCSLKAYRREVLDNLKLYGEMHRFIPAVATWYGIRLAEVKVNHRPRTTGRTKYGMGRTLRVLLDLMLVKFLLSYSTKPIQIFGRYGLFALFGSGLALLATIAMKIWQRTDMTGNPLLLMAVLLAVVGGQMIALGILGEMNVRIYHESTGRPIYAIREVFGAGAQPVLPERTSAEP
jgi:glycosyltransferase involved in cell wall biosynthesis